MVAQDLPTTDEEIEQMILAGEGRPRHPGWTYVNWQNDFPCLVDTLISAYEEDGALGFRTALMSIAEEICVEALDRDGHDGEPTNEEILATALRIVFTPENNVGTRNNFALGAISEIHYREVLREAGFTIMSTEKVTKMTAEADDMERKTASKQESAGWDIVAIDPEGFVQTFQIKATSSKPSWAKSKEYDHLIWYKHTDKLEAPEEIEE